MNIFSNAARAASAATLAVMGEEAVIVPRVRVQYAGSGDDPDRDQHVVTGVFSGAPEHEDLRGQRRGEIGGASRAASMSAEFWLSPEQVAALEWRPRKGDALRLSERPGQPVYAINWVEPTDMGDLTLQITIEGKSE